MNWFLFLIGALATFRLSMMISRESGPARIFRKLRKVPPPKSSAKEGLSCPLCVSIHVAIPVTWFFWWRGHIDLVETPIYWLATSAVTLLLHSAFTRHIL